MATNFRTPKRFSKQTQSQEHCRLFNLPPELRNIIFDFVYNTPETNDDGTIDLESTDPPTTHLVLARQKSYIGTYALLKTALQIY